MFALLLTLLQKIFLLGHIQSGSFPKPLSEKEELELLERYEKNGDTEAKNKLIEHNLRLVAHIVKKYAKDQDEADDLLSIGTIGLIKGINTYNQIVYFENIDAITAENAKGAELSIENATSGMTAPFHAGAAKYFAEKGVNVATE